MPDNSQLTQSRLKQIAEYHPETGKWVRLQKVAQMAVGSQAGGPRTIDGRWVLRIDNRLYLGSRLAVLYMTGEFPVGLVDHRDGDKTNDKWKNLRVCDRSENGFNKSIQNNNSHGWKWLTKHHNGWMWRVKNKARIARGYSNCPAAAQLFAIVAADKMHGEFMRVS